MSFLTLPTFDDPFYDMLIDLEGVGYRVEFRFNQRNNCWYFDLSLEDGTELLKGIKIVPSIPLLSRFANRKIPAGILMAVNNAIDNDLPPGLIELGPTERVQLNYVTEEELT